MNNCVNKWTTNLAFLNDEEFEELLNHAEICQFHTDILDKYEADVFPFIKLACPEVMMETVLSNSVYTTPGFWGKILSNLSSLKNYLPSFILETPFIMAGLLLIVAILILLNESATNTTNSNEFVIVQKDLNNNSNQNQFTILIDNSNSRIVSPGSTVKPLIFFNTPTVFPPSKSLNILNNSQLPLQVFTTLEKDLVNPQMDNNLRNSFYQLEPTTSLRNFQNVPDFIQFQPNNTKDGVVQETQKEPTNVIDSEAVLIAKLPTNRANRQQSGEFTYAPSYLPDAPFINSSAQRPLKVITSSKPEDFTGDFNQMQRGASPGGDASIGIVLFGDARLRAWLELPNKTTTFDNLFKVKQESDRLLANGRKPILPAESRSKIRSDTSIGINGGCFYLDNSYKKVYVHKNLCK